MGIFHSPTAAAFAGEMDRLKQAHHVAVIGHIRPDGDAIGSVTGLVTMLRQAGVTAYGYIGQPGQFADDLLTIPHAEKVRCAHGLPKAVDAAITVDCSTLDRTGTLQTGLEKLLKANPQALINVDHHASNTNFGSLNLVEAERESVTAILFGYIQPLASYGVHLNLTLAHQLYAGLVTDTGSFRWGNPAMFSVAAELVAVGLDTQSIAFDLMDHVSVDDLKFRGEALSRIQVIEVGALRLALIAATHDLIEGRAAGAVESLVEFVRAADETDIGVVFKELAPGSWTVSLRSRTVDVAAIATRLGGGGHTAAAGYSATGTVADLTNALVAAIAQ
ncbi:MAG: DHH family phosphoesterase [Corynebacterium sp.]|nr:DHH family phosphoesterase [Corynebacterium sp.]